MKILFVEDNAGFAGDLTSVLLEIPYVLEVVTVRDKESAIGILEDDLIDLIVLDLSIPPSPATDVPDPEHGQDFFHTARELHPGTPIFILTGSEADKLSRGLAKFGDQIQPWGHNIRVETVSYFLKEEVDDLVVRVTAMALLFEKMNSIAINTRGRDLGLRVRPGSFNLLTKSSDHHPHGRPAQKCEPVPIQAFPILRQPPAAVQPTNRALNDPAFGQDNEPAGLGALHDFDIHLPTDLGQPLLKFLALIAGVSVELQQERVQPEQRAHQQHAAIPVLGVSGKDHRLHQQSLRVYKDMPLLALDFLARVIAMRINRDPPFSAPFTL